MLRAGELAKAAMPKHAVMNMLVLPSGSPSQQVMLQVRFAEVNRNALQQSGLALFATRADFTGRTTTQQFPAPDSTTSGDLKFTDFLNVFLFSRSESIGGVLKALQGRGFLQSLAEPNLIAYNGQEASFLAGGEIPIPLVSGLGQMSVEYKEFGVRLNFTPTIAGDVIRLKLRPEVSTLDFTNGILLSGFRIPALNTRRAETDVELRDGQSFAIAGLLNNLTQTDRQAIPLISRVPIIGTLFQSRSIRAEQTELMVLVTPRLVRALDPDEVPTMPVRPGAFINPPTTRTAACPARTPTRPGLQDAPPPPARRPPPGAVPPRPPGRKLEDFRRHRMGSPSRPAPPATRWSSQRGAVLIHVAIAMIGLTGFSALVVDYGILWSGRRQAQNAADAAALAAATSLGYVDVRTTGRARELPRSPVA